MAQRSRSRVAIGRVSNGAVEANAENIPHGVTSEGMKKLYRGHVVLAGGAMLKDRIQFAFGADFVEVRGYIRAPGRSAVRALAAPLPPGRSSIR
jgi:xanthine dehydrogenase YagR molybdenum-binding subunit